MKKGIFFILIFFVNILFSSQVEIINLPLGRSLALASETSLVDNRVFNVLTNPAMLFNIEPGCSLEYNKLFYYGGTSYDVVGFSFKNKTQMEEIDNVGIIIGKFSSGNIQVRSLDGELTNQTVEYSVTIAGFGFSYKIFSEKRHSVWLGLGGYSVSEKIDTSEQYWCGNLGVIYEYVFRNKNKLNSVRLGSVIKGLGLNKNLVHNEAVAIEIGKDILPVKIIPLVVIFGYENIYPVKIDDKFKLGIVSNIYSSLDGRYRVILDLGYNLGRYTDFLSFGFEIKIKNILLNYSFTQHAYLGNLHDIMLSLKI